MAKEYKKVKKKINIYSSPKLNNFLVQLFPKHIIDFKDLADLIKKDCSEESGIVFHDPDNEIKKINFKNLLGNYLIISNIQPNKTHQLNDYIYINAPVDLSKLKSDIENFITTKTNKIQDIEIVGRKLINYRKKISCFLTEVESEILSQLIKSKNCKKSFIKENILNIKNDIETNSLESHLTRIRKKLDNVKSNIRIQSKNETIHLFSSSEVLD